MNERICFCCEEKNYLQQQFGTEDNKPHETDAVEIYQYYNKDGYHRFNGKLSEKRADEKHNGVHFHTVRSDNTYAEHLFADSLPVFKANRNDKFRRGKGKKDGKRNDCKRQIENPDVFIHRFFVRRKRFVCLFILLLLFLRHCGRFFFCHIEFYAVFGFICGIIGFKTVAVTVISRDFRYNCGKARCNDTYNYRVKNESRYSFQHVCLLDIKNHTGLPFLAEIFFGKAPI